MNQQREVIYSRRRHALLGEHLREDIFDMLREFLDKTVAKYYDEGELEQLREVLRTSLLIDLEISPDQWQRLGISGVKDLALKAAEEFYRRKTERIGTEGMSTLEKFVALQVIDEKWKDHLREMDDLKEGIHLRAYGQKDPIVEYKTEAFNMFVELLDQINTETLNLVFKLFPSNTQETPLPRVPRPVRRQQMTLTHDSTSGMGFQTGGEAPPVEAEGGAVPARQSQGAPPKPPPIHVGERTGRNDPCPCGSGKKYKQCHGK
jgi:preprotein translocase subunit SecA